MAGVGRGPTPVDKERSTALAQMNLKKILRAYIHQMVDEVPGYKALLLDKDTMRICSTQYGRTELGEHNVVHVERLDNNEGKEHMELKAVCFLRPTRDNVRALQRELRQPRYQSYHLYFTNLVNQMYLQDLAEADAVREQIQAVQEFYGDFLVVDASHFTVPVPSNEVLINPRSAQKTGASEFEAVDRLVQGLSALFLALRRRPIIRYQRNSEAARRTADSLYQLVYRQQVGVFDFGSRSSPVVLLLDRRDDPVTPLLVHWSYAAMIHDLIGINDNTLQLTSNKVAEQYREVVLDASSDDFFRKHANSNYGEVGLAVKEAVEAFAKASNQHKQVNSLEDMRRFVLEHSDFSRAQANVTKHVSIMSQLAEVVGQRALMDVSTFEQELANSSSNLSAGVAYDELLPLLRSPSTSAKDRVRLVALYCLRYEGETARLSALMDVLRGSGLPDTHPELMAAAEAVLGWAGQERRCGDLWGGDNILLKAKNVFKGLQGVDNVYMQHTPLLAETLRQLSTNNLPTGGYPYMAASTDEAAAWGAAYKQRPPSEVIVFVIGGSTLEEAKAVEEWNAKQPPSGGCRVVLGGSAVVNCDSVLQALGMGQL